MLYSKNREYSKILKIPTEISKQNVWKEKSGKRRTAKKNIVDRLDAQRSMNYHVGYAKPATGDDRSIRDDCTKLLNQK